MIDLEPFCPDEDSPCCLDCENIHSKAASMSAENMAETIHCDACGLEFVLICDMSTRYYALLVLNQETREMSPLVEEIGRLRLLRWASEDGPRLS